MAYIFEKQKTNSAVLTAVAVMLLASCTGEEVPGGTPALPEHDIVVMYENDVHCDVDGYAKFAALRSEFQAKTPYVATVSAGDFVQGGDVGSMTSGDGVIDIMNKVGYDYVTIGNHEFDYGIERMTYLTDKLNATIIDANFCRIPSKELIFQPYGIKEYGKVKVAYIGLSTPSTLTSTSPLKFMDENGNRVYDFMGDELDEQTNRMAEQARNEGADYVVLLSHLGDTKIRDYETSFELIGRTRGIDAVLDGHAHSIINDTLIANADGKMVHLSSTGTKFQNMGVLTIDTHGNISTSLYDSDKYDKEDAEVKQFVEEVKAGATAAGNVVIGHTDFKLSIYDADGKRIVRQQECGIGNFIADSYREIFGTDVAVVNSGGVRADIEAGDITYNNIFNVTPFGNTLCSGTLTGQQLLDALEVCYQFVPNESGSFMQVSGMRFHIDTSVNAEFVMEDEFWVSLAEGSPRRVSNLEILNRTTGNYEPVDPSRTYTIASNDYVLRDLGCEAAFRYTLCDTPLGVTDAEVTVQYFRDKLHGVMPAQYATPEGRITVKACKTSRF